MTRVKRYYGTGANSYAGQKNHYTFRGHLRGKEMTGFTAGHEISLSPRTVYDIDWMGRTTAVGLYVGGVTWPTDYTDYAASTATSRAALSKTYYDVLGRVYRAERYTISSADGSAGSNTQTNNYYDARGHQVATAPRHLAGTETAYDGLGRAYQTRTVLADSFSYSSGVFEYRAPTPNPAIGSMSGGDGGVVAMSHTAFDALGNAIQSHSFETVDTDTDGLDLTNNDDYVRRSVYRWYDGAGRVTAEADYGCGNTATDVWQYAAVPNRPTTAPSTSATVLVTQYGYNADSGRLETVTDPLDRRDQDLLRRPGPNYLRGNELRQFLAAGHEHRRFDRPQQGSRYPVRV